MCYSFRIHWGKRHQIHSIKARNRRAYDAVGVFEEQERIGGAGWGLVTQDGTCCRENVEHERVLIHTLRITA